MHKYTRIFRGLNATLDADDRVMGIHASDITRAVSEDGYSSHWHLKTSLYVDPAQSFTPRLTDKLVMVWCLAALAVLYLVY